MPPMVMDEVLLLVDTYFKVQATDNKQLQQVHKEELSATLRSLPFYPEFHDNPTYRNIAGMHLLLMQMEKVLNGTYPRSKISKLKCRVLDRYQYEIHQLGNIALAIRYISDSELYKECLGDIDTNFLGGSLILGYHEYLETRGKVSLQLRQYHLDMHTSKCSVCLSDLSAMYGVKGESLLELHLANPIEWYTSKAKVTENSFIVACPNCHSLAHSDPVLFNGACLLDTIQK